MKSLEHIGRGNQGGAHIVVGLQSRFFDPTFAEVSLTAEINGEVLAESDLNVGLRCNQETGALEAAGLILVWDPGLGAEQLVGELATVRATLRNDAGVEITSETELEILDPN